MDESVADSGVSMSRVAVMRVLRLRDRIRGRARPYIGQVIAGQTFDDLVAAFAGQLPAAIPLENVRESLRYLAGQTLTAESLRDAAWRLAANTSVLRRRAVQPWVVQSVREWAPVLILRMSAVLMHSRPHWQVAMPILAGSACPLIIVEQWSPEKCRMLAVRGGFSRRRPSKQSREPSRRVYCHPLQLCGLRLRVLLEAGETSEPRYSRIGFAASDIAANRRLLDLRDRRNFTCPRGYPPTVLCHQCPAGWNECPAAVRLESCVEGQCSVCGQIRLVDTRSVTSGPVCLRCQCLPRQICPV